MLNLAATTDKLQLITAQASTIDVHASFVDVNQSTLAPSAASNQATAITTATTTDIVSAPAATTTRNVKFLCINNKDASNSNSVTVQHNANSTLYKLLTVTLLPGEELMLREGVWFHYASSGGVYTFPTYAVDVQVFTATGANTWTKPTAFTPKSVFVKMWGGGGGGGAGASLATAVVAKGGGGGGGGAYQEAEYVAADVAATVTVTIGTGGTAGTPGAAGAAGGDGGIGGTTSFGTALMAYGGGGGRGGAISAVGTGGGGGGGTGGAGAVGTTAGGTGGLPTAQHQRHRRAGRDGQRGGPDQPERGERRRWWGGHRLHAESLLARGQLDYGRGRGWRGRQS